jgi:SPP1 family predicted phage head-tail adaptor
MNFVLDRHIVLEKKTTVQDEFGQPVETWTTTKTLWANRRDLAGLERFRANQEMAERTSVFTFRWFAGLNAGDWRIKQGKTTTSAGDVVDLIWDIKGLAEPKNTRRQYWEVTASASRA